MHSQSPPPGPWPNSHSTPTTLHAARYRYEELLVNPTLLTLATQVWALARHLGIPDAIVSKPASADLIAGQTDEGDFGISYARADAILHWLLSGYDAPHIVALGYTGAEVTLVKQRLDSTHWKRRLPTVAMVSQTAIGEYYLRPVDY